MEKRRLTIYIRPKRDRDIWDVLEGVEGGDISDFLRELLRDGIKFRRGGHHNNVQQKPLYHETTPPDFSSVTLKKREVDLSDLESRFDKL